MELRPYQQEALSRLRSTIAAGARRVVLVAPTGAGKTVVARDIIAGASTKGNRVLFVAPRKELIEQCSATLNAIDIDHGVMQASHWRTRPGLPVQVATTATLLRRETPAPAVLLLDEAHLNFDAALKLLARFPAAHVIGLTATPCRTDGRGLGEMYQQLIEVATPAQLIDDGYLVPFRVFAPPPPDMSAVPKRGGDWAHGALAETVDKPHLTGDAVLTWLTHAQGRSTLVFGVGVAHSQHLAEAFRSRGVEARHVDGTSSDRDRGKVLADLRSGALPVACCADLYTYGVDAPAVSAVVVCRPTQSMALHRQMIGRGLRVHPGKTDLLLLDHAGNTGRHGYPDEPVEWSLAGQVRRPSKAQPVRTCPKCFCCHAPAPTCPECGHVYEVVKREIVERPGELVEAQRSEWASKQTPAARVEWLRRQARLAKWKGYKSGWAAYRYKATFGCWPSRSLREQAGA